ncbi:Amino acid/polyamine transporter I [Lasiodiplodia theobromae]|uniref:Amino acid/polyamine transporter I n=1 Tax=Lasiodiplodia theobromae TaxID=45133 RepID=UPI0015C308FF|nr:Amino acid/polyamine transporter I [Lasiodiplodia theobromae]KAF4541175.1 Amino acid/polyamine transporter I [Lasiodiplodia theobromae]
MHPATGLTSLLHRRNQTMISVAGAFGTGLIISSGTALLRGGPASLLIAYVLMGANVYIVMTALAEMATYAKMDKGFPGYATRFADPALGFATGYNYFCKYVVVLANNLTAAGIIIQYWRPELNVGIWITIFAFPVIIINLFHVRVFGESQYIAGVVKLVVMTMLIISCLVASLKPVKGRGMVGFRYWKDPGSFGEYLAHGVLGRFLGFWAAFVQAGFAYIGTEVSFKSKCWYVHWKDNGWRLLNYSCDLAASPFVIAVKLAGFECRMLRARFLPRLS